MKKISYKNNKISSNKSNRKGLQKLLSKESKLVAKNSIEILKELEKLDTVADKD